MSTDGFFGQRSPQSAVKARIVSKYFWSWAKNVGTERLAGTASRSVISTFIVDRVDMTTVRCQLR